MLKSNPIGWVSIPAIDISRAVAFYNQVFDLSLEITEEMGPPMAFLPGDRESPGGDRHRRAFRIHIHLDLNGDRVDADAGA